METKNIKLDEVELKMDSDTGEFTGYASKFGGVDSYNDTIMPGAYDKILERGKMPMMFFNHASWEVPIGVWKTMVDDGDGLLMTGQLLEDHSKARDVRAAMKAGALDGLSIGFRMTKDDFYFEDDRRYIKNISELVETSVVTFPADDSARVDLASVKAALDDIDSIKDFENYLRDAGGFSKGAAQALISRFKSVLSESKQQDQTLEALKGFKFPDFKFSID